MAEDNYEDIINLPHHVSETRPRMSMIDRAAQFSPFAALTGHDAALSETARLTDTRIELDDCEKEIINEKLIMISDGRLTVTLTYFRPDEIKFGGAYTDVTGTVKKMDTFSREIVMTSGERIPVDEILNIDIK